MELFNFDSLVGAQSVQNSLDHGKQGSRFFLTAFIDKQAYAANRRAVALRTIVKQFSCVYFKRTNNFEQGLELWISTAHFHIDDGAHISIALVGYFFLCETEF